MSNASFMRAMFNCELNLINDAFRYAPVVKGSSWQSTKAPDSMVEVLDYSFRLKLVGENLDDYRQAIQPNLPWADMHFEMERVSGEPINPGTTWRLWPFAHSANRHRRPGEEDPQFDHTYAERYWPKYAGKTKDGRLPEAQMFPLTLNYGYRFDYGDLNDLVELLTEDPLTRQAYLPIWFPEDLAAARLKKRVPCSLGYHFIYREGKLNIIYYMRSVDYIRHFRDDVYLTIRLLLWVLKELKMDSPAFSDATPGTFTMHITSLHMFESDWKARQASGWKSP